MGTDVKRILIIESNKKEGESSSDYLDIEGIETATVDDPETGLDKVTTFGPDMIVIEFNLPGQNGLEITTRIRNSDLFNAIPIILITTQSDDVLREKAIMSGVSTVIDKATVKTELPDYINRFFNT
jgi:two-component system, NtrC family, sensor kinase